MLIPTQRGKEPSSALFSSSVCSYNARASFLRPACQSWVAWFREL